MFNTNQAVTASKPKQRTVLSSEAKRLHVKNFENSQQTMSAYCKVHDIAISTFSTWVIKFGEKKESSFVPVQVCNESQPPVTTQSQKADAPTRIEIHRGELKVVLPISNDPAVVIEVIKGVFLCN